MATASWCGAIQSPKHLWQGVEQRADRGADARRAYALALDFDGVAVDDPGPAGDLGLSKVGREYQRNSEKDQGS